jgi:ribokinase
MNIHVIGSINMDLVAQVGEFPKAGETITGNSFFTAHGGKGANQAVGAARLGSKVQMIGCVGEDISGQEMKKSLASEGIDVSAIKQVNGISSGTAIILVNDHAENQIVVIPGSNHKVTFKQVETAFHASKPKPTLALFQFETPLDVVWKSVQFYHEQGVASIVNSAPAYGIPEDVYQHINYLIANEHEAEVLTGESTLEEAANALLHKGAQHVIITLGEKGSLLATSDKVHHIKPYSVKPKDTTAAGDAFVAGFAHSIANGTSLVEAVSYANAVGALATTKHGAQPSLPHISDLKDYLSS